MANVYTSSQKEDPLFASSHLIIQQSQSTDPSTHKLPSSFNSHLILFKASSVSVTTIPVSNGHVVPTPNVDWLIHYSILQSLSVTVSPASAGNKIAFGSDKAQYSSALLTKVVDPSIVTEQPPFYNLILLVVRQVTSPHSS